MHDEIHDPVYDDDGDPLLNEDGTPATWFDLMAGASRHARKHGMRLETTLNPVTGERGYAMSGAVIDQIKAHRAATGCSLQEALTELGITWGDDGND